VLLATLLIGGVLMFVRFVWQPAGVSPAVPPVEMMPTVPQPSSEPIAQATTAPAPTAIPAPTEVPAIAPPAPTVVPAPSSEPLDQLRALLEAGRAEGSDGRLSGALLSDLSKAKQALDDGNKERAADRLRDLQKRLSEGVKSKRVDADFARQALAGIDTIAGAYGLELPPIREQDDKDKNK